MKDAYSFDIDEDSAKKSYNKMFFAYLRTFKRLGLKAIPMTADTGPIGGDLSHEFIILAETGESKIYADKKIFNVDLNKFKFNDDSLESMKNLLLFMLLQMKNLIKMNLTKMLTNQTKLLQKE